MIDPEHDLPIKQQAEVLEISRSTVYYEPRLISAEDLWLMRQIDELHLNYPFAGSRMLRGLCGGPGCSDSFCFFPKWKFLLLV
jgi:putative transposase